MKQLYQVTLTLINRDMLEKQKSALDCWCDELDYETSEQQDFVNLLQSVAGLLEHILQDCKPMKEPKIINNETLWGKKD